MSAHETPWVDIQDLNPWPSGFLSSSDILPHLPHQESQDGEQGSNNCEENVAPSAVASAQNDQHLMRPPPRPVCENIYALPFTPTLQKPEWSLYGNGIPLQNTLSSQYAVSDRFGATPGLEKDFDGYHLLETLAAFPDLDTDPRLVEEMLSSEGNAPDVTHMKQDMGFLNQESLTLDTSFTHPVLSSPFSLSSSTASFSDLSAYSELPAFSPDYNPRSSITHSSTPLSPAPSPKHSRTEVIRSGCPSRATPSPRAKKRIAPYTLDGGRNRWSTVSVTPRSAHTNPPPTFPKPSNLSLYSSPSTNPVTPQADRVTSVTQIPRSPQPLMPSSHDKECVLANSVPLASQGKFPTLQSGNDVRNRYFEHYFDLPGPPDLLGPLKEEPLRPPPEDWLTQDPSKTPHEQELRFENDLYTPRWVRRQGNKRQGWCGICKPGKWLVLKNSEFWYDKSYSHGISAATGQAFALPTEMRRTERNANLWEGLCGTCGLWVPLVSSKKKGTSWFRHAYKCQQKGKPKETLKRRRDSNLNSNRPSPSDIESNSPHSTAPKTGTTAEAVDDGAPQDPQSTPSLETIASMI